MQNLNRMQAERARKAPYCITMLLTPDYRERAKGKPEAPKAQTLYYCTGRSRASSSETAPKGYKIPHLSTRRPLHSGPRVHSDPRGTAGHVVRHLPKDSRVTGACRQGSPYYKKSEANPTFIFDILSSGRHFRMSGGDPEGPGPDLKY